MEKPNGLDELALAKAKIDALESAGLNVLFLAPVVVLIDALKFYATATPAALDFDAGITARCALELAASDMEVIV